MSVAPHPQPPMGNSPGRAEAKETIWRLSAFAFAHPAPEFYQALSTGSFHAAFAYAWQQVTGQVMPRPATSKDFPSFEAGFIAAFAHGVKGKPIAPLMAGDHAHILAGLTRPVFMLNLTAFYKHFGLKAAVADEGRADEPDHLASMFEFMSVLCHLEASALAKGRDPSPYRRAQRDFLCRYLHPTLDAVAGLLRKHPVPDLDPTLFEIVQNLAHWAEQQVAELEARIGTFRDPDTPKPANTADLHNNDISQNLWG